MELKLTLFLAIDRIHRPVGYAQIVVQGHRETVPAQGGITTTPSVIAAINNATKATAVPSVARHTGIILRTKSWSNVISAIGRN